MNDGGLLGWPTWIGVVVEDLDAQRRFWGELLGLPEDHSGDDFVSFKTADGRWFELIERSEDAEYNEPRFEVAFAVDDIKTTYEQLVQRGVEAITPIYGEEEPWAYFRDPEGRVFRDQATAEECRFVTKAGLTPSCAFRRKRYLRGVATDVNLLPERPRVEEDGRAVIRNPD